jgi:putative transposase
MKYYEVLNNHRKLVETYKDKIPINKFNDNRECVSIKSDSWFDIKVKNNKLTEMLNCKPTQIDQVDEIIFSRPLTIFPSKEQKPLLFKWFEAYRCMYNATLKLIKHEYLHGLKCLLIDWKELRTMFLSCVKELYMKKYNVPSHILDGAIKSVCTAYKSAITNFKRGNIKKFQIRYIKKAKKNLVLSLEKINFNKNGFFVSYLGKMQTSNNFDFTTIGCDPKLYYNYNKNRFSLLIPEKQDIDQTINKNKSYVGIDGGVRTFLTGISNKGTVEIGTNLKETIKKDFKLLDKIKRNNKISDAIKKKYEKRINERTANKIKDMHWKAINYMTNNYDNIIIGKLSTKSIVNKETSKIDKMTKRIALKMAFYQFLERLKYKCQAKNINLQIVNEAYTSKLCCECSTYNDVGGSKIYRCRDCGIIIDRDVNGAINICMNGLV